MSNEPSNRTARSWRIALAAIVAFACSQLVLAGHQFEHEAGGIEEVCVACLQLDQFDTPPVNAAGSAIAAPCADRPKVLPEALAESGDPVPYSTRAPPLL